MTDTEVWAAADVDSSTYSRYKSGKRGIALDDRGARTVEKLARVFRVEPSYFMEYRIWEIARILRSRPTLADLFYEAIREQAAQEDNPSRQPTSRRKSGT
jgi:transcriptional regulator with XRE-family HTH domain